MAGDTRMRSSMPSKDTILHWQLAQDSNMTHAKTKVSPGESLHFIQGDPRDKSKEQCGTQGAISSSF